MRRPRRYGGDDIIISGDDPPLEPWEEVRPENFRLPLAPLPLPTAPMARPAFDPRRAIRAVPPDSPVFNGPPPMTAMRPAARRPMPRPPARPLYDDEWIERFYAPHVRAAVIRRLRRSGSYIPGGHAIGGNSTIGGT